MESLTTLDSDSVALLLPALLSLAALVFALLWIGCRRKIKRQQTPEVPAAGAAAPADRPANQYLDTFPAGEQWTLLVSVPVTLNNAPRTLGLAQTACGEALPFLTTQAFEGVKAGARFCADDGRLVPVVTTPPAASPAKTPSDSDMTLFLRPGASRDPNEGAAFLKVESGVDQGRHFPIGWGRTTMGRAASNPITLGDSEASRVHAEIHFDGLRFNLHDNGSTNGTLLNGQPLSRAALKLGDVIKIGATEMIFTCDGMECMRDQPQKAISAFEAMLRKAPDYMDAVRQLAFLLERDIKRKGEADGMWKRLAVLEKKSG